VRVGARNNGGSRLGFVKVSPKGGRAIEPIAAAVCLFMLLAGCYLLTLGLRGNDWALAVAGFLIEAVYLQIGWLMGEGTWVDKCVKAIAASLKRLWYVRAERKYRRRQAGEFDLLRLADVEQRVNELVNLRIERRLLELERADELRTRQEWTELRDVWRVLVLDPNTPEEVRASCRQWLAKYPETLDFLARRLMNLGLLWEKELVLDEDWEVRERHKWRIQ
jgi:hypothetical protein